jgi:hypothetical protein
MADRSAWEIVDYAETNRPAISMRGELAAIPAD